MGKASKFFKTLFGFKATNPPQSPSANKQRWSFIKLHHNSFHHSGGGDETTASNDHAIAVAAATAAVAEAAVAAAEAAAEVVRMTSRGTAGYSLPGEWAAIKIQSCFRAYLARKALRALKALVKLQALVRGYIQRKSDADDLRRRQALLRVQARARARARAHARRLLIADSPNSHSHSHSTTKGPPTPEKYEHVLPKHHHPSPLKSNGLRYEKILEIDTTKPYIYLPKRRNLFHPDHVSCSLTTSRGSTVQPSGSCEVNSMEEETVQNSPLLYASTRVSESWRSGYEHPNYMAYTESSLAKVRSVSAPRHRPQLETAKRYLGYGSERVRDSFVNKAYPGSGRLDRLGMPIGEVSGSYWN